MPIHLNQFNLNASDVGTHIGNLAAQAGFSRFAEWDSIAYDKSPNFPSLTTGELDESIAKANYSRWSIIIPGLNQNTSTTAVC